jgi:hypothetical protein
MTEEGKLVMWTIYERPRDMPGIRFVARKWLVGPEQTVEVGVLSPAQATNEFIPSDALELLREVMLRKGLLCLPRSAGDDPVIVETWL